MSHNAALLSPRSRCRSFLFSPHDAPNPNPIYLAAAAAPFARTLGFVGSVRLVRPDSDSHSEDLGLAFGGLALAFGGQDAWARSTHIGVRVRVRVAVRSREIIDTVWSGDGTVNGDGTVCNYNGAELAPSFTRWPIYDVQKNRPQEYRTEARKSTSDASVESGTKLIFEDGRAGAYVRRWLKSHALSLVWVILDHSCLKLT
ncbi:hypothetical protein C8R45DRAFT_938941 [Mycena sanguinolenta]|nr:hypothetical protein C8R45DRAFT_938941 [Mycena sanguinolenta]